MDVPARFNLPALSLRAIRAVLLHFDIPDLLSCSQTSLRFCNIARSLKYKTTSLEVFTDRKKTYLKLKNGDEDGGMMYFKKDFDKNVVTVSLDEDQERVFYNEYNTELYSSLTAAIIYVTDVLRITVSKISIWPVGMSLTTLHNLAKLRIEKCEELEIKVAASTKSVYFPNRVLVKVIRNICGTERFHLGMPMKEKFKCDPSYFKCHHLTIDRPTPWLTGKILFKMRCAQMEITQSNLKVKDLLDFVKKWMKSDSSEHREFEYLDITLEKEIKDFPFPDTFQAKKWNKKLRGQHYLAGTEVIDCEHGGDVVHKDGRIMATVCIQNERKRFFFGVWHNPFPVIPQENVPEIVSAENQ
ncbi:hypothetical protein GCK72_017549 [Caenorhabditis remanei]|uniref:Uncharacterized protein n=1 Tax=Caenorhabditis remanei TaxID=31234 RepID=A0A6A5G7L7_CAERE|nr:hypothetical protein GCK72_017549 [Caenorhabditis remanei]KAF1750997.1 hypothetical protein GCK72_017549 [Caenorhabditis remanei]